ncbi:MULTISPECIES: N(2)-fixation sustaining protein CowN [unclassified Halorhodospira]|uniref:N(2)-fixation sustaining protein CowN n=1 Tax=unclassified Halorhodospira TaxID=2626748 RepID=UPI001EE92131|nr:MULTISPECIES: N(2)-fixation sustaining protein CowN [unclassified Halorhodospira]MCG5541151.1 N(2)-fixation sustaining protein CowN [Halorhodospira sp. M39old]MCG5545566.1 N(2)-fixation sustaining protein CowN [Halorhodospira sp. M38]
MSELGPGLDCERAIQRLLQCVDRHIAEEPENSRVRRYLERELGGRDGSEPDTRLMVHAQINVIRELFVQRGDDAGLSMLSAIERECC